MFACCRRGYKYPESIVPPLIFCPRLVKRVPAGVGSFPQAGHPQHADALSGVVAVWDRSIPGRHHQWGWVGGSVRSLSAGCDRVHGNSLALSFFLHSCVGLMKSRNTMYASVTFVWTPEWFASTGRHLRILVCFIHLFLFHSIQWVSPSLPACGSEMLSVLGTRIKPSCPARSPSSVHVWIRHVAWKNVHHSGGNGCCVELCYVFKVSLPLVNLRYMLIHMMHLHLPLLSNNAQCSLPIVAVSCVFGVCLGVSKDVIGYIFTSEKWVQILAPLLNIQWFVFNYTSRTIANRECITWCINLLGYRSLAAMDSAWIFALSLPETWSDLVI